MSELPGLAIGVDVGGTKLAAGLVAAHGGIRYRVRRETPGEPEAILAEIVDVVAEIEDHHAARGLPVGVGLAAIIDGDGVARYAPNLPLIDRPVLDELRRGLDRTAVTVDNDANVAAWGEYRVGAGTGAASSLLMLTVGTGVGGGLVLDGRLVRGARGFAGEFGHILVDEGGPRCACGNRGCLEALASGTAIGRVAREALAAGAVPPDSALRQLQEVTGKAVTVAAQAGDRFAVELLARCGFWLGVGIASLVNALDPEIVVVGGGAMQAGQLLLKPALAATADRLTGAGHRPAPPVVRAQLSDDAGLVGAALLALGCSRAERKKP
ncbi:MAG: ROK family protein [Egibacteraceae bacterium]